MSTISVDDLISFLPRGGAQFPLSEDAPDLQYVTGGDLYFVPPRLSHVASSLREPVVLIEARAAVGKSTLARYVAWATGSPLWDLSGLFVGSGTVWGRLVQGFGADRLDRKSVV